MVRVLGIVSWRSIENDEFDWKIQVPFSYLEIYIQ